jgi:iron(III) transport system substrate-binding protein
MSGATDRSWFRFPWIACGILLVLGLTACRPSTPESDAGEVVVYCAQDQVVAEPLLAEFTRRTGIRVQAVFDSEAVKTVGLANRLLAERSHPTAEVFWGNEELRTRQLAAAGVFRDPDGWWSFGRRTRCWVVRSGATVPTDPSGQPVKPPESLVALTNATWRGRISMAFPMFGTTSTHLLALRQHWGAERWTSWCEALAANRPFLEEGNSQVVRRVARGEALIGLTDSDDVRAALREGMPVRALPLGELALSMPNTVALVARSGGTRPQAESLVTFLRSPEVETLLIAGGALDPKDGATVSGLRPDWNRLVVELDPGVRALEEVFHR